MEYERGSIMKKARYAMMIGLATAAMITGCGTNAKITASAAEIQEESLISSVQKMTETVESDVQKVAETEKLSEEQNMKLIGDYFVRNFSLGCTVFSADVDHDGYSDVIVVDDLSDGAVIKGYVLTVKDGEVKCIEEKEGSLSHSGGFNWFLNYNEENGQGNLIEYVDHMWQGYGQCELVEYYLDAEGHRVEVQRMGIGDGYEGTLDKSGMVLESKLAEFNAMVEEQLYHKVYLKSVGNIGNMDGMMIPQGSAEMVFGIEAAPEAECSEKIFGDIVKVALPEAWEGRYVMVEEGNRVGFYSKANYDAYPGMGKLFELVCSDMQSKEELDAQNFPDYRYIGQWSGGIIYGMIPTDVQFDMNDPALTEEYLMLSADVSVIMDCVIIFE